MKLIDYIRLLLRHLLAIGLVTILVTAGVYLISESRPKMYTATSAEYFSVAVGNSAADLAQGSNYVEDQMASYGELATSPIVLNPVIDDLSLGVTPKQLARSIVATTPRNTVIVQLSVTAPDPERAAAIANAVGAQLSNALDTVGPKLPNGKALIAVRSIQTALPPTVQSSPNTRRDTAFGLVIGLLLSCGVIIASARLDSRVRTATTLAEITTRRTLGTIRHAPNLAGRAVVIVKDPHSRSAEDIRQLRANLEQLASGGRTFALVVTSSIRAEGRSTIAVNLAAALAEVGRRVVLVDADLRRPHISEITGADPHLGVLTSLGQPAALPDALQTMLGGYTVLGAGGSYANPAELLSSPEMGALIDSLREQYDFVIIDAPALLDAADATAVHSYVDGAVLLAHAKRVRRNQLENALKSAELAGLNIFGVVLNEVRASDLPSSHATGRGLFWRRAEPDVSTPPTVSEPTFATTSEREPIES